MCGMLALMQQRNVMILYRCQYRSLWVMIVLFLLPSKLCKKTDIIQRRDLLTSIYIHLQTAAMARIISMYILQDNA